MFMHTGYRFFGLKYFSNVSQHYMLCAFLLTSEVVQSEAKTTCKVESDDIRIIYRICIPLSKSSNTLIRKYHDSGNRIFFLTWLLKQKHLFCLLVHGVIVPEICLVLINLPYRKNYEKIGVGKNVRKKKF